MNIFIYIYELIQKTRGILWAPLGRACYWGMLWKRFHYKSNGRLLEAYPPNVKDLSADMNFIDKINGRQLEVYPRVQISKHRFATVCYQSNCGP